jgi:hypothetical protein
MPSSASSARRRGSSGRPASAFPLQQPDAARIERTPRKLRIARRIDPFGEPQPHQQKLVGALLAREHVVGRHTMAACFHAHQPGFGALLRGRGMAGAVNVEPSVCAGADPGIFLPAPVNEIMPAFGAGTGMVGNFICRKSGCGADILRHVI